MAPNKEINKVINTTNRITTRSKTACSSLTKKSKRKADDMTSSEISLKAKRSVLGELTNNRIVASHVIEKGVALSKSSKINQKAVKENVEEVTASSGMVTAELQTIKIQTRASTRKMIQKSDTVNVEKNGGNQLLSKKKTRVSIEQSENEESLYSSALEEINVSNQSTTSASTRSSKRSTLNGNHMYVSTQLKDHLHLHQKKVPVNVMDFDKENWDDIFQASHYAMDIFDYLQAQEAKFPVQDYMQWQDGLSPWMRSLLVDWMVEVQESFELNHETLYLGVKLVDLYLCKKRVMKDDLQLVGAAAMFIASKIDDRIPPQVDDILYICDGAYNRKQFLQMEINVAKVCDFKLGVPISYRFLRRYGRCAKVTMPVLTLARYILELGLMDYNTVTLSDSKFACAALYLALQMKSVSGWTKTLEFYTGYKLADFITIVFLLNDNLHKKPSSQLATVRNKYSHTIFYEVAKTPLINNATLKP